MDKKEFRLLIKYCFLKGKNTVEAKTWLDAKLPDTAPGKSTINDWIYNFRGTKKKSPNLTAFLIVEQSWSQLSEVRTLQIFMELESHTTVD
ncbi:hypothetical protein GWI33_012407 [Rhynchophorus ferrugineus]|uniref:Mos1 transposase HTH domain-containing protein n=1 Tax=Rhynchophorus ferrugineus TaxID=354439 RepID=A0A834I6K7_RHYFE|nr:hypothetical protein GWI33_012407 [Rhynchophorus ferrugineus]